MDPCFCLCFLPFVSCFLLLLFSWLCSLKSGIRRDFFGTKRSCPYLPGKYIMNVTQNLMDRLRPLVGSKGWDYCVSWKLSEDQRYIELVDCCCAGTDGTQNGGEELQFPVSSVPLLPCRDVMFQHPRTKSCALLAQLPSSMPLDSGIYAQTLMSNLPGWLNFCDSSDSTVVEEAVGTRVLIPVAGGLVELFVAKHVSEDQQIIDFVTSECNFLMDQETMINSTNMDPGGFSVTNVNVMIGEHNPKPFSSGENDQKDHIIHFQQPQPASPLDLPYDLSVDQIRASNSPMNFLHQFSYNREENRTKMVFPEVGNEFQDMDEMHKSINNHTETANMQYVDALASREQLQGNDKDSEKQENGRSGDAISDCSHQMDDELDDNTKYRRRGGKGPQAKNLMAERKRRKKLNERLHTLRSLVPNISKLDKASILVDAIDYVKQLQKQVRELEDELEENSDDEGARNGNLSNIPPEILNHSGGNLGPNSESALNSFHLGADVKGGFSKPNQHQESEITHDHDHKGPQMEPQVEVAQINGKEFFVKVFCEHKPGGFMRLMEALEALGLEVTNANATSFRNLVSNVFKVEKKDCEMLQADYVRDSLLEVTRQSPSVWPEMPKASDQDYNGVEYNHPHHHQHHSQLLHDDHITCNHHQLHHSIYS